MLAKNPTSLFLGKMRVLMFWTTSSHCEKGVRLASGRLSEIVAREHNVLFLIIEEYFMLLTEIVNFKGGGFGIMTTVFTHSSKFRESLG